MLMKAQILLYHVSDQLKRRREYFCLVYLFFLRISHSNIHICDWFTCTDTDGADHIRWHSWLNFFFSFLWIQQTAPPLVFSIFYHSWLYARMDWKRFFFFLRNYICEQIQSLIFHIAALICIRWRWQWCLCCTLPRLRLGAMTLQNVINKKVLRFQNSIIPNYSGVFWAPIVTWTIPRRLIGSMDIHVYIHFICIWYIRLYFSISILSFA